MTKYSREENAEITGVSIFIEDHGILTAFVTVSGNGWGVGIGGYAYDYRNRDDKSRVFSPKLAKFVRGVCETVGVTKWEDLKGQNCRVRSEGAGGPAIAIGHIIKDCWLDVVELHK